MRLINEELVQGPVACQGQRHSHALTTPKHPLQPARLKARKAIFSSLVHLLGGDLDQTTLNLMFPSVK